MNTTAKEELMRFLRTKRVAVLSTISSANLPMSATIYFAVDDELHFYFQTKIFTRKYENLQQHTQVALVVGTEDEPVTMQLQGKAEKLEEKEAYEEGFALLKEQVFKGEYVAPLYQLSEAYNEIVLYRIVPTWIRWLDLRDDNPDRRFIQILP